MKVPKAAILVDTATGWGRRVVRGVLDYTMQHGPWDIWIEPKGQNETFRVPAHADVSGVIARVASADMVKHLKSCKLPTVNVSSLTFKGSDFPRVTIDWPTAAELAETHFRERSLQNFAYAGPLYLSYVREHENAFEKKLAESGTPCHVFKPEGHEFKENRDNAYTAQLIPWLKSLPKPVGIFTWGFQIGRDIITACRKADIVVPHDVAVLGGDYDELLSDACLPALSGIVTPARQIGYQAMKILHSLIQGIPPPASTVFIKPLEIEDRMSTEMLAINDPRIIKVMTYLRDHACEAIQVEDILREVPMARRSLERCLRQVTGRTPAQEIKRIRINQARRLLSKTNLSVEEIAEACGYASYNYLGNVFKQETGFSPGQYRHMTKEGS